MYTLMLLRDVVKAGIDSGELRAISTSWSTTNALWAEIHGVTRSRSPALLVQTAPGHDAGRPGAVLDGIARWLRP